MASQEIRLVNGRYSFKLKVGSLSWFFLLRSHWNLTDWLTIAWSNRQCDIHSPLSTLHIIDTNNWTNSAIAIPVVKNHGRRKHRPRNIKRKCSTHFGRSVNWVGIGSSPTVKHFRNKITRKQRLFYAVTRAYVFFTCFIKLYSQLFKCLN